MRQARKIGRRRAEVGRRARAVSFREHSNFLVHTHKFAQNRTLLAVNCDGEIRSPRSPRRGRSRSPFTVHLKSSFSFTSQDFNPSYSGIYLSFSSVGRWVSDGESVHLGSSPVILFCEFLFCSKTQEFFYKTAYPPPGLEHTWNSLVRQH